MDEAQGRVWPLLLAQVHSRTEAAWMRSTKPQPVQLMDCGRVGAVVLIRSRPLSFSASGSSGHDEMKLNWARWSATPGCGKEGLEAVDVMRSQASWAIISLHFALHQRRMMMAATFMAECDFDIIEGLKTLPAGAGGIAFAGAS
jgi:hypothetical protein